MLKKVLFFIITAFFSVTTCFADDDTDYDIRNTDANRTVKAQIYPTTDTGGSEHETAPIPSMDKSALPPATTLHYCPAAAELKRNDLMWTARDGLWKSYTQSFAKEIESYVGVQWLGVNVGKVICLYRGKDVFDFPIALEPAQTILIIEPNGGKWQFVKVGYKHCKSVNTMDCPFSRKTELKDQNLYDDLNYQGQAGETHE